MFEIKVFTACMESWQEYSVCFLPEKRHCVQEQV